MTQAALSRTQFLRRAAPFAIAIGAAFGLTALPPYPPHTAALLVSGIWTAVVVAATVIVPWHRLPAALHTVPPLGLLPPIALLNYADQEIVSIYAPLAVLPVIWIALFGSRRSVLAAIFGVAAMFLIPIGALGSDFYASQEWKLAILWIVSAAVLGLATEGIVRRMRRRADEEAVRATELKSRAEETKLLLENARALAATLDRESARRTVCDAARAVAKATFSALLEPDSEGNLVATAVTGLDLEAPLRIVAGREPSGAVTAFTTRSSLFVPDARNDPTVSKRLVTATRSSSVQFEPVLRGDHALGVLVVGWRTRVAHSPTRSDSLGLIAAEAAMALERAQLLERLEFAARTDELTSLPNRRGWDDEIARELARAKREGAPLCIAVVDLDYFKRFNDSRGHQAGDRLLKEAASAWRSALRVTDILARYGGEEFSLALPSCSLDDAHRIVERLRTSTPGGQTVSAGIAQWDGVESAGSLFARADAALYAAKRAGKNCVSLAAPVAA